jgi:hypothetical protein
MNQPTNKQLTANKQQQTIRQQLQQQQLTANTIAIAIKQQQQR